MNRASRRVLNNFEKAVGGLVAKGQEGPAQAELAEAVYEVNKGAIEALIEYLEKPKRSVRERELQKAVDEVYTITMEADGGGDEMDQLDTALNKLGRIHDLVRSYTLPGIQYKVDSKEPLPPGKYTVTLSDVKPTQ